MSHSFVAWSNVTLLLIHPINTTRPGRSLTYDCVVGHCKGDLQRGCTRVKPSPGFSSQGCFHLVTSSPSKGLMVMEVFLCSGNTLTSALPGLQALPSSPAPTPSPGSQKQGVRSVVTAADSPIITIGERMS